jgi:hypothetical protein
MMGAQRFMKKLEPAAMKRRRLNATDLPLLLQAAGRIK